MCDYIVKEKTNAAVQAEIDNASANGGGRVVVPAGVYEGGTIYLKSNVELHLMSGAKISGSTDWNDYPDFVDPDLEPVAPENSRKALIIAARAENISITGFGEINGNGVAFYDTNVEPGHFFAKPPHPRPRMIQFLRCRNVRMEGVSFIDSPGWTMWLRECEDIFIHAIRLHGCQQMINNDGIDIDGCKRVQISDSSFITGDDCLILRAIRQDLNKPVICEDVTVSNCTLNSWCQGVRVGCPSDDTIRNCVFSNLTIKGINNGIICNLPVHYLRAGCNGYADISNIKFQHITIHTGRSPIYVNIADGLSPRRVAGLTFSDIDIQSKPCIFLKGSELCHLEDITLRNVRIRTKDSEPVHVEYVDSLRMENCSFTGYPEEVKKVELDRSNCSSWETFK